MEQDRQIENIEKKKDADFIGRIPSVPFTDGRFGMLDGLDVQRDWWTSASDDWDYSSLDSFELKVNAVGALQLNKDSCGPAQAG
jgi:hypothetical protein